MRAFRLRKRLSNGLVAKSRDYIGIDKLYKFGKETAERYARTGTVELCEYVDSEWVVIDEWPEEEKS